MLKQKILNYNVDIPAGSWRYVPELYLQTQSFHDDFYDGDPFDVSIPDFFSSNFIRSYLNPGGVIPNNTSWMDFVSLIKDNALAQSQTAWTLSGLKVGDFNCTADVDGEAFSEPGNDNEFLIEPGSQTSINQNQEKIIEVKATSPVNIAAWQFGATFPADTIGIIEAGPGSEGIFFDADNFNITPAQNAAGTGKMNTVWYSPNGNGVDIDGQTLFSLTVQAHHNISNIADILKLSSDEMGFKFFDAAGVEIDSVSLFLKLTDVEDRSNAEKRTNTSKLIQVRLTPNLFSAHVLFEVKVPGAVAGNIHIFDASGTKVADWSGSLQRGVNEVTVPNLNHLPSGVYWYQLEAGINRHFGKIVKY